jgi:hypothetical protein
MDFTETEFYKQFGNTEWKVTTNDGKIHKSKKWLLKHEDVLYKQITPHTHKKTEVKRGRK